jgi:hypothetical protein
MSGGGKSSTSTSSVSIPPEVLARYNSVNTRAENVAEQGFTPYEGQFVAPLTQTQQAGISNISQAAGAAQPYFEAATQSLLSGAAQAQPYYDAATQSLTTGQAGANQFNQAAAGNITGAQAGAQPYQELATGYALAGSQGVQPGQLNTQAYMSPYIQSVADPTFAALRQQQQQEQQNIMGNQIRSGAFGGDRGKIAQAVLAQQQGLSTAQAMGNIYQQGYGQALSTAQQQQGLALSAEQANRQARQQAANQFLNIGQQGFTQGMTAAQQQAALGQQVFGQGATAAQQQAALGQGVYGMGAGVSQGLAGLGTGAQQAALQGGQAQLAAGTVEQQTQQANNQAQYNQFLQQQGYPFQVAQFLANIAMGTGALSGSTTTTQQPQSFFSDERLKEDVEPIGKTFDGQEIVRFKYKGEPGTRIGLVAQDVEKKHPKAVGLAGGYKTVDYDAATDEAAARAPKAYGGGLSPWDGNSMGGSVFREDAGAGFAAGGAPGGDDVLAQINALVNSHQGMYPYGKAGMYGGGMGKAGPYGSTLMQAPNRNLLTAPAPRQEPPYDARQAMRDISDVAGMPERIQKGYSGLKAGLVGTPGSTERVTNQAGETVTRNIEPTSGMFGRAGEVNLRESGPARTYREAESWAEGLSAPSGNARGGAIRPGLAMGGLPYSQAEDEHVPEDVSKPMEAPKLQTASTGPMKDQGAEDAKTAMQMAATAAAIFAASDRRLKDNIEPIGKLFDGQKVYRYNLKGDDKTQIGLMAQEVEKRHPDAVGLAPRKGYANGGDPVQDEMINGYSRRAIEDMFNQGIIPIESRGQQFNAQGEPLRSRAGATGISQVMPSTGPEAARLAGLEWDQQRFERDPEYNRDLGLAYFTQQVRQQGDPLRAAAAYNAGPGRVQGALAGGEDYFGRLPAETQDYLRRFASSNPGGLIPPALIEQVIGRQPTAAGTSAPSASGASGSGGAERSRQTTPEGKDWFGRNESWIMPLVTGLGTMASSPSRYLGSAVLQGLMGAGQAAQQNIGLEGQRKLVGAQEAQVSMITEEVAARIAGTAYNPQLGRVRVMRPDGRGYQFISLSEYTRMIREGRAPQTGPSSPSQTQREPQVQNSGAAPQTGPSSPNQTQRDPQVQNSGAAPSGSVPPGAVQVENLPPLDNQRPPGQPAPQGTPTAPEAPESPIYFVLPREIQQSSASLAENIMNTPMGALRADQARNIWPDLSRAAAAQYATVPERNAFAGALSGIAEEGPLSSGPFGQQIGVPAVSWANSLLRSLGVDYQIRPEELATAEEARKMVMRSGIQQQAESGSRAFQELRAVLEAVPNAAMSRQAQADLIADLYISSQRQIDLNNFANLYRENLRVSGLLENQIPFAGERVETDFARRQNPIYAEEKRILSDMFMARTADGKPLIKELIQAGGVPPPAVIEALERRYGPRGLEVLRFFRGS